MLWAYFSFSQLLIVWSGNLTDEIPWYLRRLGTSWGWLGVMLIVFEFIVPFLLLLSKTVKRNATILCSVVGLIIFMRFVDLMWIVMPSYYQRGLRLSWLNFSVPLAIGGLWMATFRPATAEPSVASRAGAESREGYRSWRRRITAGFLYAIASFTGTSRRIREGCGRGRRAKTPVKFGSPSRSRFTKMFGFEKSDINDRGVLIGGACLLGGMWLTIGLLFFYFVYLKNYRAEVSPPALPIARIRSKPSSGTAPSGLAREGPEDRFASRKTGKLTHYYWLDKSKGRVAIPIEQAMQMLAQRGIPPQRRLRTQRSRLRRTEPG